jgi:hypothetical protein
MADTAVQLREQIRTLQAERRSLESELMQPQSMLPASLIERFLRDGGAARATPAYYLSRSEQGRSKLAYVNKEDLSVVRQRCAAYRAYQQNLKQWRQVTAGARVESALALNQRWGKLRQALSE